MRWVLCLITDKIESEDSKIKQKKREQTRIYHTQHVARHYFTIIITLIIIMHKGCTELHACVCVCFSVSVWLSVCLFEQCNSAS